MVPSARRYDPVIDQLVVELDDPGASMAETCRRVADRAQELGFTRPSLVHLRTLVREERARREYERRRREELAEITKDVTVKLASGRVPHPLEVIDRIAEAGQPQS